MAISPEYLRPQPGEYPPYYETYFSALPDGDLFEILGEQARVLRDLLGELDGGEQLYRYADGKWSVKEVVGHMMDTERIFAYRALRILRGDATPLAGFEQDEYVAIAGFDDRLLDSLLDEFDAVRKASLLMLQGRPREEYFREGIASGHRLTVRALVTVLAGHAEHHIKILRDRYLRGLD